MPHESPRALIAALEGAGWQVSHQPAHAAARDFPARAEALAAFDVVLLFNVASLEIEEVWADGNQASQGTRHTGPVPQIDWPGWASQTINLPEPATPADFAIAAPEGRTSVPAAVLRPFHWHDGFLTFELAVVAGMARRDAGSKITRFAIIHRYSGGSKVAKMFWMGPGPATEDTALA